MELDADKLPPFRRRPGPVQRHAAPMELAGVRWPRGYKHGALDGAFPEQHSTENSEEPSPGVIRSG